MNPIIDHIIQSQHLRRVVHHDQPREVRRIPQWKCVWWEVTIYTAHPNVAHKYRVLLNNNHQVLSVK